MLRLPNLLATTRGRLAAFFFLYMTEGIPLGFAATAVATQLRRQGVGPAEIGGFVASFYLPWAFKWAFGPVIDVFHSTRFGRRRGWIILTQVLMASTLMSTMLLSLPAQLGLFTAILLVHNTFGAMQDVAIDALAVNTLREEERGLANGLMFGGAAIGQTVGGSGVLFLSGYTGFQPTFVFVSLAILLVTLFVVLPMREAAAPAAEAVAAQGARLQAALGEMRRFAVESFRSFLGTRGAFAGLFFSLLPPGAMCLGLALQSNLAVELGMNDDQVAWLNVWSTVINAAFCVLGGHWSDRFGRRRTLALYIAGMSPVVLYLMFELQRHGWVMPVSPTDPNRPHVPPELLTAFWIATLAYNVFNGLMYGTRAAIMMDVTNPAVAATQFTAYMAMANLAISYSASWQGIAIEAWGYPTTMLVDAVFGLVCLLLIPMLRALPDQSPTLGDGGAPLRARLVAAVLGVVCIAWVPYAMSPALVGKARPILDTVFTLVFVGSALFLLASRVLLAANARGLSRLALLLGPLMLAMHLRYHLDSLAAAAGRWGLAPAAFSEAGRGALMAVAVAGGALLLVLATRSWRELSAEDAPGLAGAATTA